ncbi:hypothetical protein TrVE_jg10962 [Triparma verrucosa]|uniref:Sulfotransferase domain-containing protein n=1 Tax=Triparma verrucosa TaxID=1606542 RepID=A0A9W7KXF3_9STRA|nr:hypothetical protein TrVE_jg10962 [Triparma verrucosa]
MILTEKESSMDAASTFDKIDSFKKYLSGDSTDGTEDLEDPFEDVDTVKVAQKALPAIDPADYPTHSQMVLEKRRRTVIVAGSQKCGTSALAAYLSSHPSIRFSKMKEVHHFDQNSNFKKGLKKYDAQWPLEPEDPDFEAQVEELGDLEEPTLRYGVRAEATPYYIASKDACSRIAKTFDREEDDYRLVVMIREPTDRAWSEYQMEMRRILDENTMKEALEKYAVEVFECYMQFKIPVFAQGLNLEEKTLEAYNECVPEEFMSLARFKKFEKVMSRQMKKGRASMNLRNAVKSQVKYNLVEKVQNCWEAKDPSEADAFMSFVDKISRSETYAVDADAFSAEEIQRLQKTKIKRGVIFKLSCLGPTFFEKLNSPQVAFSTDMQSYRTCKQAQATLDETSLTEVTQLVKACYKTPAKGITKQFLYRSMYAAQLQRCIDSGISPSKIFLIDSEDFKSSPSGILKELHEFIGVEDFEYEFNTPEDVHAEINNRFPTFELTTGWRFDGSTEEMPEKIRKDTTLFMRPFNLLLKEMMANGGMKGQKKYSFEP